METRQIRTLVLIVTAGILLFVFIWKSIEKHFVYLMMSVLILQCVKAVFDFLFGLPMNIGYSDIVEDKAGNMANRVLLLCVAIALAVFGIWWITTKLI